MTETPAPRKIRIRGTRRRGIQRTVYIRKTVDQRAKDEAERRNWTLSRLYDHVIAAYFGLPDSESETSDAA